MRDARSIAQPSVGSPNKIVVVVRNDKFLASSSQSPVIGPALLLRHASLSRATENNAREYPLRMAWLPACVRSLETKSRGSVN